MANNPSKPAADGGTAIQVLADYADWSYTESEEDPVEPEPAAATTAAASDASAAARGAGPGPKDWAEWVARKLAKELRRLADDPSTPEPRRAALRRSLDRVKDWR